MATNASSDNRAYHQLLSLVENYAEERLNKVTVALDSDHMESFRTGNWRAKEEAFDKLKKIGSKKRAIDKLKRRRSKLTSEIEPAVADLEREKQERIAVQEKLAEQAQDLCVELEVVKAAAANFKQANPVSSQAALASKANLVFATESNAELQGKIRSAF
ncbi:unnamed protein product [Calypogeia fissa]